MKATYSPEDNKLRLYSEERLDPETYKRVKDKGFIWAPKQGLFVAPAWSPSREDLLIELCGEIEDEDKSLVERQEERAERFEKYSENRLSDAENLKDHVKSISDNIPFGQPILVGHHSQRHAEKDAKKIENGMKQAIRLWETSKYWADRASGALAHAKYKERPDVRARRIKGIEADIRRMVASYTPRKNIPIINQEPFNCPICGKCICDAHPEAKVKVPNAYCGQARGGSWVQVSRLEAIKKSYERSIKHCENRLIYEKAMLNEAGAGHLIEKKERPKIQPILNYKSEFINIHQVYGGEKQVKQYEMTSEEYKKSDGFIRLSADGSHRVRMTSFFRCKEFKEIKYDTDIDSRNSGYAGVAIFLTDSKVHPIPEQKEIEKVEEKPFVMPELKMYIPPVKNEFELMKESLKTGIKTVTANQLFPTPDNIVQKMVEYCDIKPGHDILEPSAGTGNILKALPCVRPNGTVTAIEKVFDLKPYIEPYADNIFIEDFLTWKGNSFDRIIMNPPFENGVDIKHIRHAMTFLADGGILVALCANGPRQREEFKDLADYFEDLPEGSFKNQGTNVNVALIVITK